MEARQIQPANLPVLMLTMTLVTAFLCVPPSRSRVAGRLVPRAQDALPFQDATRDDNPKSQRGDEKLLDKAAPSPRQRQHGERDAMRALAFLGSAQAKILGSVVRPRPLTRKVFLNEVDS